MLNINSELRLTGQTSPPGVEIVREMAAILHGGREHKSCRKALKEVRRKMRVYLQIYRICPAHRFPHPAHYFVPLFFFVGYWAILAEYEKVKKKNIIMHQTKRYYE